MLGITLYENEMIIRRFVHRRTSNLEILVKCVDCSLFAGVVVRRVMLGRFEFVSNSAFNKFKRISLCKSGWYVYIASTRLETHVVVLDVKLDMHVRRILGPIPKARRDRH